jgi:hypothetical protein
MPKHKDRRQSARQSPLAAGTALAALLSLCCAGSAGAAGLDAATQAKVRAATFEVVTPKPETDTLTYEKPLPLDLLPYRIRVDKYFPLGTAFALGPHRFATASHVLSAGFGSQFGAPALRYGNGRVYPIAKIVKYNSAQDFAVFTIDGDPGAAPLKIDGRPTLNDAVYAVGNALGEGVVFRDGLYTSDTPEDVAGRWKWLRFSAAASPGNSGGPLLDKDGKLIGIVLAKSPNENLNFAVAIQQVVDAPDNLAVIDTREQYQLDIFDDKKSETLHRELTLPMSFAELGAAYLNVWNEYCDRLLHDLLADNAATTFPNGDGSADLLHSVDLGTFPALIMRRDDGVWDTFRPEKTAQAELPHNGLISYGSLKNQAMLHLRRPDDVPAAQFYGDSQLYMDTLLKGIPINRAVGSEKVKITSLGKAAVDRIVADKYGRKWQLREWPLQFQDQVLISLALPVPDGYAGILRISPTAAEHSYAGDMIALADFAAVAYGGTLPQWRDFLAASALLPTAAEGFDLHYDYGKQLSFRSHHSALSINSDVLAITADSRLIVEFSYFGAPEHTVWDVAGVEVSEDAHTNNTVRLTRNLHPTEAMDDNFKSWWNKIAHRQHPFDAVAYNDGDLVYIFGVKDPPAAKPAVQPPQVLYSLSLEHEGPVKPKEMQARLASVMQSLTVDSE